MIGGKRNLVKLRRKNLQWHFLGKSCVVGLFFLGLTIATLHLMVSGYFVYHDERQALQFARSIDNVAVITATPNHLQQYVINAQKSSTFPQITLVSKSDRSILASSSIMLLTKPVSRLSADLSAAVNLSLDTGRFHSSFTLANGKVVSILPLSSAIGQLHGNFALDQARSLQPVWHNRIAAASPSSYGRIFSTSSANTNSFNASPHTYSGAIVIHRTANWATSILRDIFVETAALIAISFICVIMAGWFICQRYVIKPAEGLSDVLVRFRRGDKNVRAQRSPVAEFDGLARQCNGLLNDRQTAERDYEIFSAIIENAPVGIAVSTPQSCIEYANPAYRAMCGKSLVDILGRTPGEIFGNHELDREVLHEAGSTIATGKPWRGEIQYQGPDNQLIACDVSLCPVLDREDQLAHIVSVQQDVTERKQHVQDLLSAKQKSEAADRAKSEFISKMSHELRTPFNAILGFASIISQQQMGPIVNPSYVEFATLIEQSANSLLATINTLITLSRIDASNQSFDECAAAPISAINRVTRAVNQQVSDLDLTVDVHDQLNGAGLKCDEKFLQTMAESLLSNAIKFSKPGGNIAISLKHDRSRRTILEVADNGIGIEPEDLKKITEPFFQAANGADRKHNGLGVGLTLVHHLARAHNATLEITSDANTGTVVKVIFPAERTVAPDTKTKSPQAPSLAA